MQGLTLGIRFTVPGVRLILGVRQERFDCIVFIVNSPTLSYSKYLSTCEQRFPPGVDQTWKMHYTRVVFSSLTSVTVGNNVIVGRNANHRLGNLTVLVVLDSRKCERVHY